MDGFLWNGNLRASIGYISARGDLFFSMSNQQELLYKKDSPDKENQPKQKMRENGWGLPVTTELIVFEAEPSCYLSVAWETKCSLRLFCFLQQDTPRPDSLPVCSQN